MYTQEEGACISCIRHIVSYSLWPRESDPLAQNKNKTECVCVTWWISDYSEIIFRRSISQDWIWNYTVITPFKLFYRIYGRMVNLCMIAVWYGYGIDTPRVI